MKRNLILSMVLLLASAGWAQQQNRAERPANSDNAAAVSADESKAPAGKARVNEAGTETLPMSDSNMDWGWLGLFGLAGLLGLRRRDRRMQSPGMRDNVTTFDRDRTRRMG